MLKHKYFEEMCTLAPLGKLSASQQGELEAHLAECAACKGASVEYGLLYRDVIAPIRQETEAAVESSRSRVENAMWASIARIDEERSRPAASSSRAVSVSSVPRYRVPFWATASTAATLVVGLWLGSRMHKPEQPRVKLMQSVPPSSIGRILQTASPPVADTSKLELRGQIVKLTQVLQQEQQQNEKLREKLGANEQELNQAITSEAALRQQIDRQVAVINATQVELDARKSELEHAQSTHSSDSAEIAGLNLQVHDLDLRLKTESASLDRERDLLAEGREIRDLMGARDLHIVDVVDRDGKGRVTKAFGRAFLTEGKSLIFYAFDLPAKNTSDGKFVYAAWGNNSNDLNGKTAHSLGIFYNDNQTLHRWALKFDDPKVLDEIDTVFVTLEPANKPFANPTGKRLLEAYFGTPPNHP